MARIVHASDLHIDGPTGPPGRATRRIVARLVDLVLWETADLVVISGDVFDRDADGVDVGRFFAAQMSRLTAAGIPVLAVAGNHDVACPRATTSSATASYPATVTWFPSRAPATYIFDDLGLAVHGQGLADPAEPRDLTDRFPAPLPGYLNLGVLHTSLDGSASRTICAPTSVARLAATGYDYWALGHVHQRQVVATRPWIVYPGSPSEPGGATLITTAGNTVIDVSPMDPLAVDQGLYARELISSYVP